MLLWEKSGDASGDTSVRSGLKILIPPSDEPTHTRFWASSAMVTTLPMRGKVFRLCRNGPSDREQTNRPLSMPTHRRPCESINSSCTNLVGNSFIHG